MTEPRSLTDADFDAFVRAHPNVLVDFGADWCAPCKRQDPVVDELAREYAGRVEVVKVDADANPQAMQRHGVLGLPTLVLLRGGERVDALVGFTPKPALRARLDRAFGL